MSALQRSAKTITAAGGPGKGEGQLSLFAAKAAPAAEAPKLEVEGLPPSVHFGTSSWTFDGWKGIVYHRAYRNKQEFTRESLSEYVSHPLLTTVGIDASFYAPLSPEQLTLWASQLPPGFRCAQKVWDVLTLPFFPDHPRYGARAGRPNPSYLSPELFCEAILAPNQAHFEGHMGPFLFEFSPLPAAQRPRPGEFAQRLLDFFSALPRGPMYAVELRNRELLTPAYLDVLRNCGVIHVQNVWSWMPLPSAQRRVGDVYTGPAVVGRWMIGPGQRYEQRVEAWSPFDRIHEPSPELRQEAVELIVDGLAHELPVYLIVNNKIEGCSPLTARSIAQELAQRLAGAAPA